MTNDEKMEQNVIVISFFSRSVDDLFNAFFARNNTVNFILWNTESKNTGGHTRILSTGGGRGLIGPFMEVIFIITCDQILLVQFAFVLVSSSANQNAGSCISIYGFSPDIILPLPSHTTQDFILGVENGAASFK